ncbi:MAG: hypothetical protein AAGF84_10910 [Planctomycetota bacterium]
MTRLRALVLILLVFCVALPFSVAWWVSKLPTPMDPQAFAVPTDGEAPDAEPAPEGQVPATTNADLDRWLREALPEAEIVSPVPGQWQFALQDRPMIIVTDERAGRMRIISPVAQSPRDPAELQRVLEANYRTALDARYALDGGLLWSAFIHPLPTLNHEEFLDGLAQTFTLAETYGTTYSSSGMRFGPEGPEQENDERLGPQV